jgi:hypothetical protein
MDVQAPERRTSLRHSFKTAMRVRMGESCQNEQRAESENLSERGTFFATNEPLAIGSAIEILLRMPQEITGKPTTEWRCTGHVVRLEEVASSRGKTGVGVQFDSCEIPSAYATLPVRELLIR